MKKVLFIILVSMLAFATEGVMIPFYHYPLPSDAEVKKLITYKKSYPNVEIIVIVNPSNGDFEYMLSNFTNMIKAFADANITVLGYLYSSYGKRDFGIIKKRVDTWQKYKGLGIKGIFVDEVSTDLQKFRYYEELSKYIKKKFSIVVFNPGTLISREYEKIADIIVVREGDKSIYNSSGIRKSAILLYNIKNFEKISKDLFSYQYIYVTEQHGANPWENISSFMPKLLEFIYRKNLLLQ